MTEENEAVACAFEIRKKEKEASTSFKVISPERGTGPSISEQYSTLPEPELDENEPFRLGELLVEVKKVAIWWCIMLLMGCGFLYLVYMLTFQDPTCSNGAVHPTYGFRTDTHNLETCDANIKIVAKTFNLNGNYTMLRTCEKNNLKNNITWLLSMISKDVSLVSIMDGSIKIKVQGPVFDVQKIEKFLNVKKFTTNHPEGHETLIEFFNAMYPIDFTTNHYIFMIFKNIQCESLHDLAWGLTLNGCAENVEHFPLCDNIFNYNYISKSCKCVLTGELCDLQSSETPGAAVYKLVSRMQNGEEELRDLGNCCEKNKEELQINLDPVVNAYMETERPNLKKICDGTLKEPYTWKLPIDGSKKLTFELTKPNQNNWYLQSIDDKVMFQAEKWEKNIHFDIKKEDKNIHLFALYPSFPSVSGIDVFQFLLPLIYLCEFKSLTLKDESDLRYPYKRFYGRSYYEYTINGEVSTKIKNQEAYINRDVFYECAIKEVLPYIQGTDWMVFKSKDFKKQMKTTIEGCENSSLKPQDCPLGHKWLGNLLNNVIMSRCLEQNKGKEPYRYTQYESTFFISGKDVSRIMNKSRSPFPKPQPSCTMDKNVVIKTYAEIKTTIRDENIFLQTFKNTFTSCFQMFPEDQKDH